MKWKKLRFGQDLVFGQMNEPPGVPCAWHCRVWRWLKLRDEGKDVLPFIDTFIATPRLVLRCRHCLSRYCAVGYQPNLQQEMGALQERITFNEERLDYLLFSCPCAKDDLTDPALRRPLLTFGRHNCDGTVL